MTRSPLLLISYAFQSLSCLVGAAAIFIAIGAFVEQKWATVALDCFVAVINCHAFINLGGSRALLQASERRLREALEGIPPMAYAVMIGPAEKTAINEAVTQARQSPRTLEELKEHAVKTIKPRLALADRKGTPPKAGVMVLIPQGFRASISFEYQPNGLYRHLSVTHNENAPHPFAFTMIADAFGFKHAPRAPDGTLKPESAIWLEEFEPGRWAVNYIEPEAWQ